MATPLWTLINAQSDEELIRLRHRLKKHKNDPDAALVAQMLLEELHRREGKHVKAL